MSDGNGRCVPTVHHHMNGFGCIDPKPALPGELEGLLNEATAMLAEAKRLFGKTVVDVRQTVTSTDNRGVNVVTFTFRNGETRTFEVMNGRDGTNGLKGDPGKDADIEGCEAAKKEALDAAKIAADAASDVSATDAYVQKNERDRIAAEKTRHNMMMEREEKLEEIEGSMRGLFFTLNKAVEAENGRANAEKARVDAEKARNEAEKARAVAEADRVTAETKREADVETAVSRANTAASSAESASASANTAAGAANSAAGAANNAAVEASKVSGRVDDLALEMREVANSANQAASRANTSAANADEKAGLVQDNITLNTQIANGAKQESAEALSAAENAVFRAQGAVGTANSAAQLAQQAKAIAEGRATGYVFDTLAEMNAWLAVAENVAKLVVGDNLYIRATDSPDYWWDGERAQVLETEHPDLSGYVKDTDWATNEKGGVARINSIYGLIVNASGFLYVNKASQANIEAKTDNYRPIVPSSLDYAVKVAMTTNTIELTPLEKAAAQRWFGITPITASEYEALADKSGINYVIPD